MPLLLRRPAPLAAALIALLAALAALAALPRAASAAPKPFAGLVSEDAFGGTPEYRAAVMGRIAGIGAGTLRQTMDWATIEPVQGTFDWSRYDAFVGAAAAVGIQVLPVVFNPPAWASSRPAQGAKRGTYPPKSNAQFAAFAAAAVRRYGPRGSFWAENPQLPAKPIRSWQVWNEPNLPVYWQPRPRASRYVALLKATAAAIKREDPTAQILTAGLPSSRLGIPLMTYIRQMYAAGAARAFDALAVNPYARTPRGVLTFLRRTRALMNARRDRGGKLWATEIGWSDSGPRGAFRLDPARQARAIAETMRLLWRHRAALRLQGVIYFNWRDAEPYPGGRDFWGLHTGLLRLDGTDKPALAAFHSAVAALR